MVSWLSGIQWVRTIFVPSMGSAGCSMPTSVKPCRSIKYCRTVCLPADGVPTIAINILYGEDKEQMVDGRWKSRKLIQIEKSDASRSFSPR